MIQRGQLPQFQGAAACAEIGGDVWFPDKGESNSAAKRVCRACEAQAECLQWALDRDEDFGIWGGLSAEERRKLQGRRPGRPAGTVKTIAHGTEAGYKAHRRRGEQACQDCLDGNRLGIKVGAA